MDVGLLGFDVCCYGEYLSLWNLIRPRDVLSVCYFEFQCFKMSYSFTGQADPANRANGVPRSFHEKASKGWRLIFYCRRMMGECYMWLLNPRALTLMLLLGLINTGSQVKYLLSFGKLL